MAAVEFEVDGHTAVITLNRPGARNAVNPEVAIGLERAADRLEADESLWLAVLTGTPPVFCAGADLNVINEGRSNEIMTREAVSRVLCAGNEPSQSSRRWMVPLSLVGPKSALHAT
jgi:enoyl-CoA hydratase/carnithine racemase